MNEVRLIDANALLNKQFKTFEFDYYVIDVDDIESAPTVEAEPVRHGYWIPEENGIMRCSNCNETYDDNAFFYFCPKCGCQMGEVGAANKVGIGAEYEAQKSENAELRRLLRSAYDGYMSIVSCKYAPSCKECINCHDDGASFCRDGDEWRWKYADEVLKLLEGNDT